MSTTKWHDQRSVPLSNNSSKHRLLFLDAIIMIFIVQILYFKLFYYVNYNKKNFHSRMLKHVLEQGIYISAIGLVLTFLLLPC